MAEPAEAPRKAADETGGDERRNPVWSGIVVVVGVAGIVLIVLIAGLVFSNESQATAVIGAAGGVVGSVVGAFFGMKLGSEGRENAERRASANATRADRHAEDGAKGRALAGLTKASRDLARTTAGVAGGPAPGGPAEGGEPIPGAAHPDLEELGRIADRLFPDA